MAAMHVGACAGQLHPSIFDCLAMLLHAFLSFVTTIVTNV